MTNWGDCKREEKDKDYEKKSLTSKTEFLLMTAGNNAIWTNNIKVKIDITQQNRG